MAGRGRRKQNLTLDEQLIRTEEEIDELELRMEELQKKKEEIEEQIAGQKKEALYQAAIHSGIHSCNLHAPLCGKFAPKSVSVARYAS